jgi:CheY-like chemotaxis protein
MPAKNPCIAVINDDAAIIDLFCEFLEDEGYTTVRTFSGTDGYKLICDTQPDLVLLDLQMEQRDSGLRVLDMARLNPVTTHIPFIILSADGAFLRSKQEHLARYNCVILEKPIQLPELLAKVHQIVGPPHPI